MAFYNETTVPIIEGSYPGRLDPTQPSRSLRSPASCLLFATYDANTACGALPGIGIILGTAKGDSKRRVVIETDAATRTCSWRFVPAAKIEPGVEDEGIWPRLVNFCGRTVYMSQDQWDLHKLDSEYECVVRASPNFAAINRKTTTHPTSPPSTPIPTVKMAGTTPTPKAKRFAPDALPDTPRKMRTPHRMRTNDTPTTCPSVVMAQSDEDEDVMMVDAEIPSASSPTYKRGRKRTGRQSRQRTSFPSFTASPSLRFGKRQLSDLHEADDLPHKKTRLHSPISQRRQFERKQAERLRKRKTQLQAKFYARKEALERIFWENHGVPAYVQETYYNHRTSESRASPFGSSEPSPEPSSDVDAPESEEEARMARIEESRRKLAELEKDKPLWEESKRRREVRESEDELQRKQEKSKREAEEKERKRMEEIRKGRDDGRYQQQPAPEREILLREKAQKMFVTSYLDLLGWGPEHAFQRYVHTADAFDKASFEKQRVTFAAIPWPILNSSFSIEDIEWEAVESFFFTMQQGMSPADFKKLVVMSHRRFHPDKWCSRKVLQNAEDDLERHLLLVAGNLVSQAITPIWEEVTGSH